MNLEPRGPQEPGRAWPEQWDEAMTALRLALHRNDQITLDASERLNQLQQILSPDPNDAGVWIHQNAWFHLGTFDKDFSISYDLKDKRNGVYVFGLSGDITVNGSARNQHDGPGGQDTPDQETHGVGPAYPPM